MEDDDKYTGVRMCTYRFDADQSDCGRVSNWLPLEPQPSCSNCRFVHLAPTMKLCGDMNDQGRHVSDTFYCSMWKENEKTVHSN